MALNICRGSHSQTPPGGPESLDRGDNGVAGVAAATVADGGPGAHHVDSSRGGPAKGGRGSLNLAGEGVAGVAAATAADGGREALYVGCSRGSWLS